MLVVSPLEHALVSLSRPLFVRSVRRLTSAFNKMGTANKQVTDHKADGICQLGDVSILQNVSCSGTVCRAHVFVYARCLLRFSF